MASALKTQEEMHSQAYGLLSEALDKEESEPIRAAELYLSGIEFLKRAVSLKFPPEDW